MSEFTPKPTLFSMIQQSATLEQQLIESGGELTPEIEAQLINVNLRLPEKVDATQLMLERIDMAAAYWTAKALEAEKVAMSLRKSHERLKDHVKAIMNETGILELGGNEFRFKLAKAKPKLTVDSTQLPDAYLKQVVTEKPDNDRIRGDLELGVPVPGAALHAAFSLRSYPNKGVK